MLATLLAHQTNGALSDFGGKLAWLAHGSILSRVGASIKSGAVHHLFVKRQLTFHECAFDFIGHEAEPDNVVT